MRDIKRAILIGLAVFVAAMALEFLWFAGALDPIGRLIIDIRHDQQDNLVFSYEQCDSDGGPFFDAYVETSDWVADSTLEILAVVPANCGDYHWVGDYFLDGKRLELDYRDYNKEFLACGACPVKLKYRIEDIEQQDYDFSIVRRP